MQALRSVLLAATAGAVLFAQTQTEPRSETKSQKATEQKSSETRSRSTSDKAGKTKSAATTQLSSAEKDFIREVAEANHEKEIRLAKLAQQKASNKEVKTFAATLIRDHQKTNKDLKQIAKKNNVELPEYPKSHGAMTGSSDRDEHPKSHGAMTGSSDRDDRKKPVGESRDRDISGSSESGSRDRSTREEAPYNELDALSGSAFDQAFLKEQVKAHREVIDKFEDMEKTAKNPELKQFISQTLPSLRSHLQKAESLQNQIGEK